VCPANMAGGKQLVRFLWAFPVHPSVPDNGSVPLRASVGKPAHLLRR